MEVPGGHLPGGHLPGGHPLEVTCQEVTTWRSPARRSSPEGPHLEVTWRHHLHTLRSLKIKSNQRSYKTLPRPQEP